jgi:hypothetical protein
MSKLEALMAMGRGTVIVVGQTVRGGLSVALYVGGKHLYTYESQTLDGAIAGLYDMFEPMVGRTR